MSSKAFVLLAVCLVFVTNFRLFAADDEKKEAEPPVTEKPEDPRGDKEGDPGVDEAPELAAEKKVEGETDTANEKVDDKGADAKEAEKEAEKQKRRFIWASPSLK